MTIRNLTIRELQHAAQDEIARRMRAGKMSRAARLYMIHRLSQTAQGGLWALLAVCIAATAMLAPALGVRAVVWAAITIAAFVASLRLLKKYQLGAASAARPFQWRANYASSLVVLGAAFGSGAMLLAPAEAPVIRMALIFAALGLGALAAAAAHRAYFQAALALLAPVAAFCALAALRAGAPLILPLAAAALGAVAIGVMAAAHRAQIASAKLLHPADPYLQAVGADGDLDDVGNAEDAEDERSTTPAGQSAA